MIGITLEQFRNLEKFRNAQGLRQAGRDYDDPALYRKAAEIFREIDWLANAEYCDEQAEILEYLAK